MSRRVVGTAAALLAGLAALAVALAAALLLTAAADPWSPHWIDSPIEAPSVRG